MKERTLRVFENRVLRKIKKDKMTGEWRKLCNEELNDLYCSTNIVRVIKPRRMRWAGHVARMGRGEMHTGWWLGDLRERDHLEDSDLDGTIMSRWNFRKWDVGAWCGLNWLRIGQVGGTCECGNGPSVFIKCGKLLTSRELHVLLPCVFVHCLSSDQTPTAQFIVTSGTVLMGVYSWAQTEDRQAVIVLNRP